MRCRLYRNHAEAFDVIGSFNNWKHKQLTGKIGLRKRCIIDMAKQSHMICEPAKGDNCSYLAKDSGSLFQSTRGFFTDDHKNNFWITANDIGQAPIDEFNYAFATGQSSNREENRP